MGQGKSPVRDFPGGAVVKNPPCNAGDRGVLPGRGTKIPHASTSKAHVLYSSRTITRVLAPRQKIPCATAKT